VLEHPHVHPRVNKQCRNGKRRVFEHWKLN